MRILGGKSYYVEQSEYQQALVCEKFLPKARAKLAFVLTLILSLICLLAAVTLLDQDSLVSLLLSAAEIFASLFLFFWVYYLFLSYLQQEKLWSADAMQKVLQDEAYGTTLSFFSTQILDETTTSQDLMLKNFFEYLLADAKFTWILKRLNIRPAIFAQKIKEKYPQTAALSLSDILLAALKKAIAANHTHIRYPDLLIAVFEMDETFQKIMFDFEVSEEDFQEVMDWQRRREQSREAGTRFWQEENLLAVKGIGKDWSGGYTINLDKTAHDITDQARVLGVPPHLFGRISEIELLGNLLTKGVGGNVVLVGPPGVGRHTILRAFASQLNTGKSIAPFRYFRLLAIDSASIVAGAANLNEVVDKIRLLFGEAYMAENVILVIDDIDALFDPSAEAGRVNATEALLPFLQSRLRIVGTTTARGWQTTIGKNPQLARAFSKLEINELSTTQTMLILEESVTVLERKSGLFFTHAALKEIVNLATKLIQNLPNPEKSLEIMEEVAAHVASKTSERVVLPSHVQRVVSLRTKIPVEKVKTEEKGILLNLESILHQRIVNQEEGIAELANALRRARSGVRSEKRPIGSFLFLGPTGVGKTETTKALSSVYFGSEEKIIRFDMSEYQEVHGINRLLGDADSREGGQLTEAIIANPFSLILLDEIEKAHPKILDIFLQVLDEGRLTDALGRLVNFTNTMIIATSNAGAELIRQMVSSGRNPAAERAQVLDHLQREGIFRPEFLNRFDAVVVFRPLNESELVRVATLLLEDLNRRLEEEKIQVKITAELAAALAKGGYSPEFGARPLKRYIQQNIENYIAKGLLSGEIQRGQVLEIGPDVLAQEK